MARLLRDAHIPRSRRLIELVLLVVAVGIGSFSMYLIDPETAWDMGKNPWIQGTVVLGVCALIAHLVLQFRARYADPFILPLVVALNGIGLAMIFRIDKDPAMQKSPVGESQLFWTGFSMIL